jgi:hypothetical protein
MVVVLGTSFITEQIQLSYKEVLAYGSRAIAVLFASYILQKNVHTFQKRQLRHMATQHSISLRTQQEVVPPRLPM